MPYGRSRLTASAQLGDPFLGGLVRGIGRAVGGFVRGGPLGALGAVIGGGRQPVALPPPPDPCAAPPSSADRSVEHPAWRRSVPRCRASTSYARGARQTAPDEPAERESRQTLDP